MFNTDVIFCVIIIWLKKKTVLILDEYYVVLGHILPCCMMVRWRQHKWYPLNIILGLVGL